MDLDTGLRIRIRILLFSTESFFKILCLITYQSSKITGHLEVTKKFKNLTQVFLNFCLLMEGPGTVSRCGSRSVQIIMDPNPGGPRTYGSGTLSVALPYKAASFSLDLP